MILIRNRFQAILLDVGLRAALPSWAGVNSDNCVAAMGEREAAKILFLTNLLLFLNDNSNPNLIILVAGGKTFFRRGHQSK